MTVTPTRNPAVKGKALPVIPSGFTHVADDGTTTELQTVPVPNRAERRSNLHGRPSSRQSAADARWQHLSRQTAEAYPADMGEDVGPYVVKIRRLALREFQIAKRTARRRVRLARSHGKKLGRPPGRRFPVPTLGRPTSAR